jgi:transposase
MSKIRKVIKFHCEGISKVFISIYLSLSRNTVKKYISLFKVLDIPFSEFNKQSDAELEAIFVLKPIEIIDPKLQKTYDFFPQMERELKKFGVTIHIMWEKYIKENPDGYQSSQFRFHYKNWSKKVNPVMHMKHKSGDKMYVDYAGKTLSIRDKLSGENTEVQFFGSILGASQYTYCEATPSQKKEDFVQSVENAMRFYEGVLSAIVPDNLKSAVIKSSRFEPTINETLADLAEHYETTILPRRAYKPRDKSLVEGAVKILYGRIYVGLKDLQFYSIEALNEKIWSLLEQHNTKMLTARPYSRLDLFLEYEKFKLRALPLERFEINYQSFATVMQNGHLQLGEDKNYYSVPFHYLKKKVKLLYTKYTVKIYQKFNRIAKHSRNYKPYIYTTNPEYFTSSHKFVSD